MWRNTDSSRCVSVYDVDKIRPRLQRALQVHGEEADRVSESPWIHQRHLPDPRSCRNLQFRSHHGWLLQNPFPAQSRRHSPRHSYGQSTRRANKAPRQRVVVICRDRRERARFIEAAAESRQLQQMYTVRTWDSIQNFCISRGIVGLQNNVKQKHNLFINP